MGLKSLNGKFLNSFVRYVCDYLLHTRSPPAKPVFSLYGLTGLHQMDKLIYHICRADEWAIAQQSDAYGGSSQDQFDGFIHFSTAAQVRVSAAKHRAGQDGLVLLSVDVGSLGGVLKWEESRGGALFPHLYGDLSVSAVVRVEPLLLDQNGHHMFPSSIS